jgi:hypothetical protein
MEKWFATFGKKGLQKTRPKTGLQITCCSHNRFRGKADSALIRSSVGKACKDE